MHDTDLHSFPLREDDMDYGPSTYKHLAFPFTITIVEDQGVHVTLDDFVPKVLVRDFLKTLTEVTEAYGMLGTEWPELDALYAALDA